MGRSAPLQNGAPSLLHPTWAWDSRMGKSFFYPGGIIRDQCQKWVSETFWHAALCGLSDMNLIALPCWICLSCRARRCWWCVVLGLFAFVGGGVFFSFSHFNFFLTWILQALKALQCLNNLKLDFQSLQSSCRGTALAQVILASN